MSSKLFFPTDAMTCQCVKLSSVLGGAVLVHVFEGLALIGFLLGSIVVTGVTGRLTCHVDRAQAHFYRTCGLWSKRPMKKTEP